MNNIKSKLVNQQLFLPTLNSRTVAAVAFLILLGGWSWLTPDSSLPASSDAVASVRPTNGTVNEHGLRTQSIETIRLGQRVVGRNPLRHQTQPPSNITPDGWRVVKLSMFEFGVNHDLQFLRPVEWLHTQEATAGGSIHIEMPELGLNGPAQVIAINPCPPIEPDDGTGRQIVTGLMAHSATNILDISITGLDEPLGVTTTHPIWSETRQQFISAEGLKLSERFRTGTGDVSTVKQIRARRMSDVVYNLKVDSEHVYQVTNLGILVHNQGCGPTLIGHIDGKQAVPVFGNVVHTDTTAVREALNEATAKHKGTISQTSEAAEELARKMAEDAGIAVPTLRFDPPDDRGFWPHFHIEELSVENVHFWFPPGT